MLGGSPLLAVTLASGDLNPLLLSVAICSQVHIRTHTHTHAGSSPHKHIHAYTLTLTDPHKEIKDKQTTKHNCGTMGYILPHGHRTVAGSLGVAGMQVKGAKTSSPPGIRICVRFLMNGNKF